MKNVPFIKMHGLGNDFVIIDKRAHALSLGMEARQRIADRRRGIGCDQLILIEPAKNAKADVFMRIYNPDGSEAEACGNATRCVAAQIMAERNRRQIVIETMAGLLKVEEKTPDQISVDMGEPYSSWVDIPLAQDIDSLHLPIREGALSDPVGIGMGNPHMVFFVQSVEAIDLGTLGPILEHHPLYPERANVEIAEILSKNKIRVRVWERGAGITQACGSGACAALVAASRRNLAERKAEIILDGGSLIIEWLENNHILMTGGWAESFRGEINLENSKGLIQ